MLAPANAPLETHNERRTSEPRGIEGDDRVEVAPLGAEEHPPATFGADQGQRRPPASLPLLGSGVGGSNDAGSGGRATVAAHSFGVLNARVMTFWTRASAATMTSRSPKRILPRHTRAHAAMGRGARPSADQTISVTRGPFERGLQRGVGRSSTYVSPPRAAKQLASAATPSR